MAKRTHPGLSRAAQEHCLSGSTSVSPRPSPFLQEARDPRWYDRRLLIPFPAKAVRLSAARREAWGAALGTLANPPHSSLPAPSEPPACGGKRGERGWPGGAHQTWPSLPRQPITPGEAGAQAPCPGLTVAGNWLRWQRRRGEAEEVSKFRQPLDLVQSLHSTGFYRNSKGTKERNTRGLVAGGRAGVPTAFPLQALEKILTATPTCRATGVFPGLLKQTLTQPVCRCFCMICWFPKIYHKS